MVNGGGGQPTQIVQNIGPKHYTILHHFPTQYKSDTSNKYFPSKILFEKWGVGISKIHFFPHLYTYAHACKSTAMFEYND